MLFRLTVTPLQPIDAPLPEAAFWTRIASTASRVPDPKREIREKLPEKLRERLVNAAQGGPREVGSDAPSKQSKVMQFLKSIRTQEPDLSQVRVRVLSVRFGSVEALISVVGAKVIAAALATTLPGAAEVIRGVAEETLRDLLEEIFQVPPSARVDGERVDDVDEETTEPVRPQAAKSARDVSLVGIVMFGLFAIVYYVINESGERNKTVQAFFSGAQEHAKAIDQLEIDLIKARSEFLTTETGERSELHKLLVSLASEREKATDQHETDLIRARSEFLLKTETAERSELYKLLVSLVSERTKATDQHETDLIKARAEMLSIWASMACCTPQPCPPKPIDEHRRMTKPTANCPPIASAVQPIGTPGANQP
jgi:hypothetical protein